MNTWNWLLHFLIIFDLVAFGIYFGGDILFTAISKVQKKSKKNDDLDLYDFEIETAPQKRSLCVDSIRMLYSGEIDEFVEKELLPDAAETMNALSEAEKTAVSLLLKAYIGFLSEEATVDEQSFPMVKETSVYKGYKQDKIEMRGDRAEMSDFPLYLNTVAGGLDRRDQTIGGFSFVVKIYAVPVVEIIGQLLYLLGRYGFNAQFSDCL